jgi:hypothetical protein
VAVVIAGALAAGCAEPPAPPPTPPTGPAVVTATARPAADYWVLRFGAYMTPAFRASYLATPEDERFAKFGEKLLDYERREELLEARGKGLSEAEIEQYRRLPDYEASRRFLEEKFP